MQLNRNAAAEVDHLLDIKASSDLPFFSLNVFLSG